LPARCCQPAVAGGVIYADLWSELSTHLTPQALFTQSSPAGKLLLQAFPFPSTLGEVTLHQLSQAGMFIYSVHGKWAFPTLLWSSPPTTTFTSFPLLVAGCVLPLLPSPSWLVYLQFWEGFPSPPFGVQGAPPSLLHVFIVLIAYYSVSLFSPGWGSVCPGGYADLVQGCLWEYCAPLSSPCGPRLPKSSGCRRLAAAHGPSWLLHLM
jgi:hypothetical protein